MIDSCSVRPCRALVFAAALLLLAGAQAADATKTAPGFTVEKIYSVPRESQGSWVALAPDGAGGLYASDQYGPLYRLSLPRKPGDTATARALSLPIGGVHGLTWVGRDLYAVAAQKSVHPTGLHRLRDTNGDGELDRVELLHPLDGDGEHGPHAVMPSPDGRSLFVLAGNATKLPALARSRVPQLWSNDALLPPLPTILGSEAKGRLGGGWICRTDLDGRAWELVAGGLRNAYALAVDRRGEVFTFDSDTEFEINLPWYRPTRVLQAVSGADFGWRGGIHKVPETAPDGWPAMLPLGLGSPTAVLFPREAKIPTHYREALWVADWSYGRIVALQLTPDGAGFRATPEAIVTSVPLPVTAICVNPADGALYFATGGRRTQSAIYRLTWTGDPTRAAQPAQPTQSLAASPPEVALRVALEKFHGRADPAALATVWPALSHADPIVRRAARTALEAQPVTTWAERALAETSPRPALAALLALARVDAATHQLKLLVALQPHFTPTLEPALRNEALRIITLTLIRGGEISPAQRATWATLISPLFPSANPTRDATLLELLVFLRAPEAIERGFTALEGAVTHEAQLDLVRSLRARLSEWTPAQRTRYLAWLHSTGDWRGGSSFTLLLRELRKEAVASAPEASRAALEKSLAATLASTRITVPSTTRTASHPWTVAELTTLIAKSASTRDVARGRRVFAAAGCFACHTYNGEGGALGPDLTAAGSRLATRDLLEAIVEPSREISDQYGTSEVALRDGRRLSGRIINYTEQGLVLAENLFDPAQGVRLKESEIVTITPSKISLMPPGLLDTFSASEILDLLAFLQNSP
ncbi:MAG: heme-binding protein [Opitutia bacterium]|nr:MAG: heme-binding protein [Opitutae bacterium]